MPLALFTGLSLAACKTTSKGQAFGDFVGHTVTDEFVRGEIKSLQGHRDYREERSDYQGTQQRRNNYNRVDLINLDTGEKEITNIEDEGAINYIIRMKEKNTHPKKGYLVIPNGDSYLMYAKEDKEKISIYIYLEDIKVEALITEKNKK